MRKMSVILGCMYGEKGKGLVGNENKLNDGEEMLGVMGLLGTKGVLGILIFLKFFF